jgi:3-dehydroshikimate dehydratase
MLRQQDGLSTPSMRASRRTFRLPRMSIPILITRAGLCSVTFRASSPSDVIGFCSQAGLTSIEWGTDRHVPVGNIGLSADVGNQTRDAGLIVASLGSYYRCDTGNIDALLQTAQSIGAPRVRIWAGSAGSGETSSEERRLLMLNLREAASRAFDVGIELALEYHGGTLTDNLDSTLALLNDTNSPNLSTYWQPRPDAPASVACDELRALGSLVSAVHVFSWWPGSHRLRLSGRTDLWSAALPLANSLGATDALLEFVPQDDPAILREEAALIKAWLGAPE